jgi:hypothetical protein
VLVAGRIARTGHPKSIYVYFHGRPGNPQSKGEFFGLDAIALRTLQFNCLRTKTDFTCQRSRFD